MITVWVVSLIGRPGDVAAVTEPSRSEEIVQKAFFVGVFILVSLIKMGVLCRTALDECITI